MHSTKHNGDNDKKQGKKSLTAAIQARLEQNRDKRHQEKEQYKESLKAKPKPPKQQPAPTSAPVADNKVEPKPVQPKPIEPKYIPKRHKIKVDYIDHYLQHLFAIKHDVQQYEMELATIQENKAVQEKLELTHFSLLYNITRCFQALKLYKEAVGHDDSKTASQPLLEDMRNMILKRGILKADPVYTFETGKALVKILSDDLVKMRKPHLTEQPFTDKQKAEIYSKLGIVKADDCVRYLIEPFPIPISDTLLFQQLKQFHDDLKTTDIPAKKRQLDIFVCIKKIDSYFSNIKLKYPTQPQVDETDFFFTEFRREINAIKILITACGGLYGVDELWSEIKPQRLGLFLKSCRTIINQVGHYFSNEISCDCSLEEIYDLATKATKLAKLNRPTMRGFKPKKEVVTKPKSQQNSPKKEEKPLPAEAQQTAINPVATGSPEKIPMIVPEAAMVAPPIAVAISAPQVVTPPVQALAIEYKSQVATNAMTEQGLIEMHNIRIQPLFKLFIENFKDYLPWSDLDTNKNFYNNFTELYLTMNEDLKREYFVKILDKMSKWVNQYDDARITTILPTIYRSFSDKIKSNLSQLLIEKLRKEPNNIHLLILLIKCVPDISQCDIVFKFLIEDIKKRIIKEDLLVSRYGEVLCELKYLCEGILSAKDKITDLDSLISMMENLALLIAHKFDYDYESNFIFTLLKLYTYKSCDLSLLWKIILRYKIATEEIVKLFVEQFSQSPVQDRSKTLQMLFEDMQKNIDFLYANPIIRKLLPLLNQNELNLFYQWAMEFEVRVNFGLRSYLLDLITAFPDAPFLDYETIYKTASKMNRENATKIKALAAKKISPSFALQAYNEIKDNLSDHCVRFALLERFDSQMQEIEIEKLIQSSQFYVGFLSEVSASYVFSKSALNMIAQMIPKNEYIQLILMNSLASNISPEERMDRLMQILNFFELEIAKQNNRFDLAKIKNFIDARLPIKVNNEVIRQISTLLLKHQKELSNSEKTVLYKLLNYLIPICAQRDLVSSAHLIIDCGVRQQLQPKFYDSDLLLITLVSSMPINELEFKIKDSAINAIHTRDKLCLKLLELYPRIAKQIQEPHLFISKMLPYVSINIGKMIFDTLFNKKELFISNKEAIKELQPFFIAMHQAKVYPDAEFGLLFSIILECKTSEFVLNELSDIIPNLIELVPLISQQEVLKCLHSIDIKKYIGTIDDSKELVAALLARCDYITADTFVMYWTQEIQQVLREDTNFSFSATVFLNKMSLQLFQIYKRQPEFKSAPPKALTVPQTAEAEAKIQLPSVNQPFTTFGVSNGIPSTCHFDFPHTNPKEIYITENGTEFKAVARKFIEDKCSFTWTESYIIDNNFKTRHQEITSDISKQNELRIKDYLANIDKYIGKLGLKHIVEVGYLTVVREEIQKDDTITIYTGVLNKSLNNGIYKKAITIPVHSRSIYRADDQWIDGSIDGEHFGNISRFMPHLPKPDELKSADLPGINKDDIATSTILWIAMFNGKALPLFTALENMKPGHPVGFSYGPGYWQGKPFWLLNKKGEKVIEARYEHGIIVKANKPEKTMKFQ